MKAFSKVEFYDRVLWKNYLAVIGVVGTIVTLISFFVTAEDIDRFSEKQLAAFLVAGLVLIFSVMWYSANHRKHAVKMINNTIVRIAEGDIFELLERNRINASANCRSLEPMIFMIRWWMIESWPGKRCMGSILSESGKQEN